jgi:hypothetical protein
MQIQALLLHEQEHEQDMNKKRKTHVSSPNTSTPKKSRDHLTEEEEEEEAAAAEEEKKERSREEFSLVTSK